VEFAFSKSRRMAYANFRLLWTEPPGSFGSEGNKREIYMKKVLMMAAVAALLIGCGKQSDTTTPPASTNTTTTTNK